MIRFFIIEGHTCVIKDKTQMKQRLIDSIKEDWRIQTCHFEYLPHLKLGFVRWHVAVFTGMLLLSYFLTSLGLLSVPCVISWDYFVLFDKKHRVFKDDYKVKRYEFIGTIWASIVISAVIIGLIVSWSK
jgi:hypothetical protein